MLEIIIVILFLVRWWRDNEGRAEMGEKEGVLRENMGKKFQSMILFFFYDYGASPPNPFPTTWRHTRYTKDVRQEIPTIKGIQHFLNNSGFDCTQWAYSRMQRSLSR